ncbi:tripartite tricarboxylate transporter substrate-binding protein [Pseudorhodoferax sp.]|uniref:tripartite tricarboxylate transporter substrate-binding protein n=1 Tax=Pseudorhodoferax sp. TaxID=1993553 RepID=UPI002DD64008|nr:tripartite tricarboxylate transporter substrate-binding protein [Pseudorhodoferax sp.]
MNARSLKRRTLPLLLLAAGFAAGPALAQSDRFPSRAIKVLIGFTAGGSTDVPFRVLAENASKILGQPVIIENKPGAGGILPAQMLQSAQPDGYTIAQIPLPVFRLPFTQKINWDPATDLQYVINLAGYSFGLVVPADSPIKNMQDYIAYAKANPGKLSYGTPGALTTLHLTMENIALQTGTTLNHIPYKGNSESLQAVIGNHVMSVADTPGWGPYVEQGRLRLLSTWGEKRSAKFPDAPTLKEVGINLVQTSPFGLAVPKGTDPKITQQLHDAFKKAMEMPNYKESLAKFDMEPYYMSGAAYKQYALDTMKTEKAIIEKLGLAK